MRTVVDEHDMHAEWNVRNMIEGRVRLRDAAAMSIPAKEKRKKGMVWCNVQRAVHKQGRNEGRNEERNGVVQRAVHKQGRNEGRKEERNGVVRRAVHKQHCNMHRNSQPN
jgi:hypothetical protein